MPKVSIIIPIFNSECFLANCIESVINLEYEEWELILVDDGSVDNSMTICNLYVQRNNKIKVLSQTNSGASSARNAGLNVASGEWIAFLDSDDWVDSTFLNPILESPDCDIIFFGFRELGIKGVSDKTIAPHSYSSRNIDFELTRLLTSKEAFYGFTWNKFYRREIICSNKLRFNENLIIKEDEEFTVRYCRHIRSLYISSLISYNYRVLSDSVSHGRGKFTNATVLANEIDSDLTEYPWPSFEKAMRQRLNAYYKRGVVEASTRKAYIYSLNNWIVYFKTNKRNITDKGVLEHLFNLPSKVRNALLTPKIVKFLSDASSFPHVFKIILYPIKRVIIHAITMVRPKKKIKLRGLGLRCASGIEIYGFGKLKLGNNITINKNTSFCFNPIGGNCPVISLGNGVNLGKYNDFGCSELIEIGEYVITAPFVHITDRNHDYKDIGVPIMYQSTSVKGPVKIGKGSWIGFGVQIMSGVTIGKHCVVGAGSVVTRDVPDYCVAVGIPAKVVNRFNIYTGKWEKE